MAVEKAIASSSLVEGLIVHKDQRTGDEKTN